MSWLTRLANTVFPKAEKSQTLPYPPSIMSSGGPWYEEVGPKKEEVIGKIIKDLLQSNPELDILNLIVIIDKIIGDEIFGSYRGYYTFQHNDFVEEARDLALSRYNSLQQNMKWFFTISRTKIMVHKFVKRFRKNHPKLILESFLSIPPP